MFNNVVIRQSLILSAWNIASSLLILLMYFMLDLLRTSRAAGLLDEYVGIIISYWWLIPLVVLISFCMSYMAIVRWDKKGSREIMYKEAVYWAKISAIMFVTLGIVWSFMIYLSRFERLDFLNSIEACLISAFFVALISHLFSSRRGIKMLNVDIKQSLILSVWGTAAMLIIFLTLFLPKLLLDAFQVADPINKHVAGIESIVDYWWGVLLIFLILLSALYAAMARLDKRESREIMYKEGIYWLKFTAIMCALIGIIWSLMVYLSRFEPLDFLIEVEAFLIAAAFTALISYIFSPR